MNRFSKQILLPEVQVQGQRKFGKSRILVVGMGGLGCPVSLYLSAAGIGQLTLVDHDFVEESNLNRQIIYREGDIGKPKVKVAESLLRKSNSQIKIEAIEAVLSETNAFDLVAGHDCVLDCTDNLQCKYILGDACAVLNVPFVSAAVSRFDGILGVFSNKDSGCYRCAFPSVSAPWKVQNCAESGVLGAFVGMIATMQANEALKVILGIETLRNEIVLLNGLSLEQYKLSFKPNSDCAACQKTLVSVDETQAMLKWPFLLPEQAIHSIQGQIELEDVEEMKLQGKNIQFVDVREAEEFQAGHLPGALNLPKSNWLEAQEVKEAFEAKEEFEIFVLYCQSGIRSTQCFKILESLSNQPGMESKLPKGFYQLKGGLNGVKKGNTLCTNT